jgi:hypothetical protein
MLESGSRTLLILADFDEKRSAERCERPFQLAYMKDGIVPPLSMKNYVAVKTDSFAEGRE